MGERLEGEAPPQDDEGLLALGHDWLLPASLLVAFATTAALRFRPVLRWLLAVSLPLAIVLVAGWLLARQSLVPGADVGRWLAAGLEPIRMPTADGIRWLAKTLIWFCWPAWPIAAWAVWAWRGQATLHVLLPAAGIVLLGLLALFAPAAKDFTLLALLPPLAVLATFGLPTLKRGAINAIDWFSVMTLSAIAAFIWLGWIAKQTGWPAQLARNAFRLAPGFEPEFSWIPFLIATAGTAGWVLLLQWRLGRRPPVLWRAVVLSTGGLVLCWLLLMTLWLPWLNYGQSYAPVARQIAAHLPASYRCVQTDGVGPAQRASFAYLGAVRFARQPGQQCDYLLVQDEGLRRKGGQLKPVDGQLQLLWQGRRAADRHEFFRLYRRHGR